MRHVFAVELAVAYLGSELTKCGGLGWQPAEAVATGGGTGGAGGRRLKSGALSKNAGRPSAAVKTTATGRTERTASRPAAAVFDSAAGGDERASSRASDRTVPLGLSDAVEGAGGFDRGAGGFVREAGQRRWANGDIMDDTLYSVNAGVVGASATEPSDPELERARERVARATLAHGPDAVAYSEDAPGSEGVEGERQEQPAPPEEEWGQLCAGDSALTEPPPPQQAKPSSSEEEEETLESEDGLSDTELAERRQKRAAQGGGGGAGSARQVIQLPSALRQQPVAAADTGASAAGQLSPGSQIDWDLVQTEADQSEAQLEEMASHLDQQQQVLAEQMVQSSTAVHSCARVVLPARLLSNGGACCSVEVEEMRRPVRYPLHDQTLSGAVVSQLTPSVCCCRQYRRCDARRV